MSWLWRRGSSPTHFPSACIPPCWAATVAVNAWLNFRYFKPTHSDAKLSFAPAMKRIAYKDMHNDFDVRHTPREGEGEVYMYTSKIGPAAPTKPPESAVVAAASEHCLVPLKLLEGYVEGGG